MTQLSITDAFDNLEPTISQPRTPEPKTLEPPSQDPLSSRIEAHLDRLRHELTSELRSALSTLPEIQQELLRTGQATLELASPLRALLSELEQMLPSLRLARPRPPRWLGIAAVSAVMLVGAMATQPAARIAVGRWILPEQQRSALEMGEGLLAVYPRLSEPQRRTLEQMLSPACASCSSPTTTPRSPSTIGPAVPPKPGSEKTRSPVP